MKHDMDEVSKEVLEERMQTAEVLNQIAADYVSGRVTAVFVGFYRADSPHSAKFMAQAQGERELSHIMSDIQDMIDGFPDSLVEEVEYDDA